MIYKRFTEKSAEEWRQIYKALQLMEFLVKHGSERVVDDARSHMSLLKMLRQFYYTDSNGKDQGVNIRHRSKELCDLLGDVERIRSERKKARAQASKTMGGVGSDGQTGGFAGGSSSRFGGYGDSASFGGFSGGVYGDGGGFNGAGEDEYAAGQSRNDSNNDDYEEYDEFNEGAATKSRRSNSVGRRKPESTRHAAASTTSRAKKQLDPPMPKEPEVDLLGFGDDEPVAAAPAAAAPLARTGGDFDDDDFDDFQSAAPAPSQQPTQALTSALPPPPGMSSTPLAVAPQAKAASTSLLSAAQPSSTGFGTQPPKPAGYSAAAPNYFTSVSAQPQAASPASNISRSAVTSPAASINNGFGAAAAGAQKPKASGDAFANLLGGTSLKNKGKSAGGAGMSMQEMAKQKSSAGLWGAATPTSATASPGSMASSNTKTAQQGSGGLDDLLG